MELSFHFSSKLQRMAYFIEGPRRRDGWEGGWSAQGAESNLM